MQVEVILDFHNKTKKDISEKWAADILAANLLKHNKNGIFEISLVICGNDFIRTLNLKHRNLDKPTDVLSFGQSKKISNTGKPVFLGDIVISIDKTASQAKTNNHSFEQEFEHLLTHGLKHLLGIHHKER